MAKSDEYKDIKLIHEGQRSRMFRAVRQSDGAAVIIKAPKSSEMDSDLLASYQREYELSLAMGENSGVVQVLEMDVTDSGPTLVMRDFDGQILSEWVKSHQLSTPDVLTIALGIVKCLDAIHGSQILYKNLNPNHVLIQPETRRVVLTDLNIATALRKGESETRSAETLEGNLGYISPEQTGRINRTIDYRTDYYSLGIVLYELLTGTLPFTSADPLELIHAHIARLPPPPHEANPAVPEALSRIVMKLIAKMPDDRYSSAGGIRKDLEACLAQWNATGEISSLDIGTHDVQSKLVISERLIGRERELEALQEAFDSARRGGRVMILLSGPSGIGKTSLIREGGRHLTQGGGCFISGKYDALERNTPYSALAAAFQQLIRQILAQEDHQIRDFRDRLLRDLGSNAGIMVDLIPELGMILGEQPAIASLPQTETENRFNFVLQRFVRVCASPEHPLVLFLDDLQWADVASLKLVQNLIGFEEVKHLMLIGALRGDEIAPGTPLSMALQELRKPYIHLVEIPLEPLRTDHVNQLISETLHRPAEQTQALSEIVLSKTGGNPLFVSEFLLTLHGRNLIRFNSRTVSWEWSLEEISSESITENVVELLSRKISKLEARVRQTLCWAATIGNEFSLTLLSSILEMEPADISSALEPSLLAGFIFPVLYRGTKRDGGAAEGLSPQGFKFAHDRIQQAAYSLLGIEERALVHRKIGDQLLVFTPEARNDSRLFDVITHLNQAISTFTTDPERNTLAELNLSAARKAKDNAANEAALEFAQFGISMLGQEAWASHYQVTLALHEIAADAACFSGDHDNALELVQAVLSHAKSALDRVNAHETLIKSHISRNSPSAAIQVGLDCLRELGLRFPWSSPGRLVLLAGFLRTSAALKRALPDRLLELPEMTDPRTRAAVQIMRSLALPLYYSRANLAALMLFTQIRFFLELGIHPQAGGALGSYAILLCGRIGNIELGYQLGKAALALVEKHKLRSQLCRVNFVFNGFVRHWIEPLSSTAKPLLDSYQIGRETGDFEYGAMSLYFYCMHSYFLGKPLDEFLLEATSFSLAITHLKQSSPYHYNRMLEQNILNLTVGDGDPWVLKGERFDEEQVLPIFERSENRTGSFILYFHKVLLSCLFANYRQGAEAMERIRPFCFAATGTFGLAMLPFLDSLIRIGLAKESPERGKRAGLLKQIRWNQKKIQRWARHAPANAEHLYLLIEAERHALQGEHHLATVQFERAVNAAQQNGSLIIYALGCELAGMYHLSQNNARIAKAYLQDASAAFGKWGAARKMRMLEETHRALFKQRDRFTFGIQKTVTSFEISSTSARSGQALDLSAVIKASQKISSEINYASLLKKLMKILAEAAAAEKGLLILKKQQAFEIVAGYQTEESEQTDLLAVGLEDCDRLSHGIVRFAANTKQVVVLDDAAREGPFATDPYVSAHQARSILCLPILRHGALSGLVYLENNKASGVFTVERIELLNLLASQAAISLDNAALYQDLKQALDKAVESERMKSEFLCNTSHELRTPLNAIINIPKGICEEFTRTPGAHCAECETLLGLDPGEQLTAETPCPHCQKTGCLKDEVVFEYENDLGVIYDGLQVVMRSGHSLLRIITDILQLSDIEAKKAAAEYAWIPVRDLLACVVGSIDELAREKGTSLTTIAPDEGVSVCVDEKKTSTILFHLLNNAIKFSERGATVWLEARLGDSKLTLSVRDQGIGIPKDQHEVIFAKFHQVDSGHTRRYGGTGLGLSIVKGLVEALEGRIWVESEPGQGSCFWVELPLPEKERTEAK